MSHWRGHWRTLDRTTKSYLLLVVLAHVVGLVGVLIHGIDFLIEPIPLPSSITRIWLNTNAILTLVCGVFVARNLACFREHWTWQEVQFHRGIFLVLFGGGVAYFARSFISDPVATFGTPFITLGCLLVLNATVATPERFHPK